jgi:hypothetical protein
VLIGVLFVLVARRGPDVNIDVLATNAAAWRLGTSGTLEVEEFEGITPWLVEDKHGRLVSNRPPGLIGIAVPAYWLTGSEDFTNGPGSLTAVVSTLGAVALLLMLLLRHFEPLFATAAVVVFALGTTTWTVSSAQLWPHGPGQLTAALCLTVFAQDRYLLTGLAGACAIVIRPVAAVYVSALGILRSWQLRSIWPLLQIGATSLVGMVGLLVYNRWLFGAWSISGGYSDAFTSGAIERFTLSGYLENLLATFAIPPNGLLLYSPIVAVAAVGCQRAWGSIPGWARSAALAGLLYVLVHAALNRASGGMPIFYRYPLEGLTLALPALTWGADHLWRGRRFGRGVLVFSALFSVGLLIANAFYLECRDPAASLLACRLVG